MPFRTFLHPVRMPGSRQVAEQTARVFEMSALQIGLLVFPKVTQLDLTGPLQVFTALPGASVHLIWKRLEPVASDTVLTLMPTVSFADCPQLDVICVPGGQGINDLLNDD